jgi:PAS domain S-box-containing protein
MKLKDLGITNEFLNELKIRGWDYAVDSIVITAKRKKWGDDDKESTPVIYANKAFEEMTGYKYEEIVGKDPRFLQGELTDPKVVEKIREALEKNEVFHGETYNYKKDGTPFIISWHIEPIWDQKNEVIAYLAIQRDLTHIRNLERQEKELQNFKENFVHMSSHQIRTPLSAIRWNIESLIEEEKKDDVKKELSENLALVEKITQRLKTILTAIDLTTAQNIKKTEVADDTSVKEIFETISGSTKYLQSEREIECIFSEEDFKFKTDKNILESVLQSILVNALVYSNTGSVVNVSCKKVEGFIEFSIKDSGMGLSKEDMEILWTSFSRGKESEKQFPDGIGSELFIAKNNIERIGGKIVAESEGRNKGAVFTLIIPVV